MNGTTVNEFPVIWKERSVAQFQAICWYLSAMTEEKHKILHKDRSSLA
jgi:hypothetical protein